MGLTGIDPESGRSPYVSPTLTISGRPRQKLIWNSLIELNIHFLLHLLQCLWLWNRRFFIICCCLPVAFSLVVQFHRVQIWLLTNLCYRVLLLFGKWKDGIVLISCYLQREVLLLDQRLLVVGAIEAVCHQLGVLLIKLGAVQETQLGIVLNFCENVCRALIVQHLLRVLICNQLVHNFGWRLQQTLVLHSVYLAFLGEWNVSVQFVGWGGLTKHGTDSRGGGWIRRFRITFGCLCTQYYHFHFILDFEFK